MSLEERVAVLETQVADLQATSRGWAEVAVTAANRAGIASDPLTKVYREVGEIEGRLDRHTETLDRHTELLEQILARLPDR